MQPIRKFDPVDNNFWIFFWMAKSLKNQWSKVDRNDGDKNAHTNINEKKTTQSSIGNI